MQVRDQSRDGAKVGFWGEVKMVGHFEKWQIFFTYGHFTFSTRMVVGRMNLGPAGPTPIQIAKM